MAQSGSGRGDMVKTSPQAEPYVLLRPLSARAIIGHNASEGVRMAGIEPEQDQGGQDVVQELLKAAAAAAREGRRDEAYRRLREAVAADPSNEAAWLWLAGVRCRLP
jgi:hypothetical protein